VHVFIQGLVDVEVERPGSCTSVRTTERYRNRAWRSTRTSVFADFLVLIALGVRFNIRRS